ncbi:MAG TPA: biotin/lipoyl-containing protein [Candidatus Limnocylindria bacterium]|nr:biotin/lipoyl-containing protein [Candidatus Limnocylindria bacterium]
MRYEVRVAGRDLRVDLSSDARFLVDGRVVNADVDEIIRGWQWLVRVDGRSHEVTVLTRDPLRLAIDGVEVEASAADERSLAASRGTRPQGAGRHEVRAPMPGLLKAVHVREGDAVERDAALVTLEAMKMENELRAPAAGRVVKIAARAGSKVEGGAVLVVLAEIP